MLLKTAIKWKFNFGNKSKMNKASSQVKDFVGKKKWHR